MDIESNNIEIYDVLDKSNNPIKSQVLLKTIKFGFEIPNDYYLEMIEANNSENGNMTFSKGNGEISVNLNYIKLNEESYKERITELKSNKQLLEEFDNYRRIKIYEFLDNDKLTIVEYISDYMFLFESNIKQFSKDYFDLYFTIFSLYKFNEEESDTEYKNPELEDEGFCIRKNGLIIYDNYSKDIKKERPSNLSLNIRNKLLSEYLKTKKSSGIKIVLPKKLNNFTVDDLISRIDKRIAELESQQADTDLRDEDYF